MILCKFSGISLFFLIFIFGSSFLIKPAYAQDTQTKNVTQAKSTFMDESHRNEIYEERRLSQATAIGYSFLLPGLGNFYAEQYFVGTLMMSAMVFAAVFATYAFSTDQPEFYLGAGLLAGGAYITAPITASFAVKEFNHDLRRALKVSIGYSGKETLGLSFRASF